MGGVLMTSTDSESSTSDFVGELEWRGLLATTTDLGELQASLDAGVLTLYCGFDPTAPSLHAGNLVPLLLLTRFQRAGHRPIALVGGATGLIGDPSGRSSERSLNDESTVASWVEKIRAQVSAFVSFDSGPNQALVVSNLDWTQDLSAIELLRNIGKHFSVNQMLAKDSVSNRLSQHGISYTEFSYMVLQAYDYLELFRRHGCALQVGGSDQWGNIVAGLDLIRRVEGPSDVHGLTVPLVTKSDGSKFGKTAGGAIWLDSAMTSPYAFYQFWLNTDDADVEKFLKLFSLRTPQEITDVVDVWQEAPHTRSAQRALAEELTTMVHGPDACAMAVAASKAIFGGGELSELDAATLDAAMHEVPHTALEGQLLPFVDLLVACGLAESKGAARRMVKEGGAYLNNARIQDAESTPLPSDLLHGWLVLRKGKRSIAGIRVS